MLSSRYSQKTGKKGKIARSKSRNLLERLKKLENDALRFMDDPIVPFSNNPAENDLRMIKVQQKMSGCFRSMDGAKIFCRLRSYLSTCRKQDVTAFDALRLLIQGKWPALIVSQKVEKAQKRSYNMLKLQARNLRKRSFGDFLRDHQLVWKTLHQPLTLNSYIIINSCLNNSG